MYTSMPKEMTRDDVKKLAKLAKLQLTNEEIDAYSKDMQSILGYIDMLSEADTKGLQPTSQVTGLTNVMRPDMVVEATAEPDKLLKQAPELQDEYIQVRRMI